ncbi:MAG: electron transport complex subunit RsxB [Gammaproteobacteria bacterium]
MPTLLPSEHIALHLLLWPSLLMAMAWLVATLLRSSAQQRASANSTTILVEQINALLPQTQCGKCGHPGCLPYAKAIAAGEPINHCPPGGPQTINALAQLLADLPQPLDPAHGSHEEERVAVIREDECIGCTKCIKACPVDAILGAGKVMHTVIASECTGCDLCVEPCPVDCIDMVVVSNNSATWPLPEAEPHPRLLQEIC